MAEYSYTLSSPNLEQSSGLDSRDSSLTGTVELNSVFNTDTDFVEILVYSSEGNFIARSEGTSQVKNLLNSNAGGQQDTSTVYVDPLAFSKTNYPNQNITLEYQFLRNLSTGQYFISDISPDKLEIKLGTSGGSVDFSQVEDIVDLIERFNNETYLPKLALEVASSEKILVVNLELDGPDLILKLYNAPTATLKSTVRLIEEIANPVRFDIRVSQVPTVEKQPVLRGPNFNIDLDDQSDVSTEYLDYTELFSYPITGTNRKVFAEMSGSGVDINVDYSSFENFVHFSSAKERLINFKYKLDLIESYENARTTNSSISNSTAAVKTVDDKYEKLIKGIISNFDGYERHLYFESGSTSWPKSNNTKPYVNQSSATLASVAWFESTSASASLYDELNESKLTYTIPEYLRQDSNNEPALLFADMIGQHFDELWTYANGITDKYDADNRLDYGISKDLVVKTLQNFGVNLYSSNFSTSNLTKLLLGEWYDPDQEDVSMVVKATTEPTPDKDILNETYKRIYHNLPFLLKTKGTTRGLKALINCFGIPSGSVQIREFGGLPTGYEFSPGYSYYTAPSEKIRLENTGSEIPGGTLSEYTSIVKPNNDYSQDLHVVEVGFSPSYYIDEYLVSYTLPPSFAEGGTLISNTFAFPNYRVDDYIGDPRNTTARRHKDLNDLRDKLLGSLEMYDVFDFIRLIKFFDNQLFKMIKDFVPARDTVSTGIIIKPHFLNRSKSGGVLPIAERAEYSASIDTAFITGSTPGLLESHDVTNTVVNITSIGIIEEESTDQKEKLNGELGGANIVVSTGELNDENPFKEDNTPYTTFNITKSTEFALQLPGYVDTYPQTNISAQTVDIRYLDMGIQLNPLTKLDGKVSKTSLNGLNLSGDLNNVTSLYLQGELFVVTNVVEYTGHYYFEFKKYSAPTTITGNQVSQVILSGYIDKDFYVDDYNALLGNASIVDTATKLQKVDFGTGMIPTNIDAIRNGTAEKANVQEYLHNSFGMRSGRYLGRQLEGAKLNEFTIGDRSYGNSPVINYTDAYFAYFRWLNTTNPLVGNHVISKANVKLWYLLDKDGNQTSMGNDQAGITLSKVQQTFKEGSLVDLTLDSSATGDYAALNNTWRVYRSGQRAEPILYSQTGSFVGDIFQTDGYTSEINFYSDDLINDTPVNSNMFATLFKFGFFEIGKGDIPYTFTFFDQSIGANISNNPLTGIITATPVDANQSFSFYFALKTKITSKTYYRKDYTIELQKSIDNGTTWTTVGSSIHKCKEKLEVVHKYEDHGVESSNSGQVDFLYRVVATLLDDHWLAGSVKFYNIELSINHSPVNLTTTAATSIWEVDSIDRRYVTASTDVMLYYNSYQVDLDTANLPSIKYPFTIEQGDELRFEGSEAHTYIINDFKIGTDAVLTLDREVPTDVDTSYFLLRRYVDDPSNLILDITTNKDGTSPGVIQTQYPSKDILNNIDTIVTKLKSENSI